YMFNWCNDLSSVIIPANITTIGYGAFSDCHELMSVYIERPYSPGDSIFGASFMFNNTNSLLSIYMPDLDTVNYYKTEATGGWVSFRSRITLAPTE
ncbi:MAG: leucine-rich repeat protein, partial [Candidatus Izemoplasmatales bacterium]|nr:leucine-rich repeat protein [Candidatus Izemoplasmatales bacterium]